MAEIVTLKILAEQLGLSISTVSRALQNHPRISVGTKKKVWELAKSVDYYPNKAALNLRNRRSNLLGIIVPRISYHFYSLAISGIEDVALESGFNVVICHSNEIFQREVSNTMDLITAQVDGIIASLAAETQEFHHFEKVLQREIPLVFFNRVTNFLPASLVYVDNYQAGYEAARHLIQQRCKRLAFVGGPDYLQISNDRKAGFLKAIQDHGLNIYSEFMGHLTFDPVSAADYTSTLFSSSFFPDGIFCVSDRLATGVWRWLQNNGYTIPDDVALIGFNNDPVCEIMSPNLSSVDQDAYEMGREAAKLCLNQLDNNLGGRSVRKVLPTSLKIRKSSTRLVL